jgi:hypothetical protein
MAFELIEKTTRGRTTPAEPEIRIGYHLATDKTKTRTIYFALTNMLIEQLG